MAKDVRIVRRAFNAGEVSPQYNWRNDTEKHVFACERLENFYVSPLGSISRREGTRLLGVLGTTDQSANVRLVPFEYNREFSYLMAFHTDSTDIENPQWRTENFSLSSPFSLCFTLPANYAIASTLIKKGNLAISIAADRKITVAVGSVNLTTVALERITHYISIIVAGNSVKIFGGTGLLSSGTAVYADDGRAMIFSGTTTVGDLWSLKLFNFDISEADAYYTLADYAALRDEQSQLTKQPLYENASSSKGSSIDYENGNIRLIPGEFEEEEDPDPENPTEPVPYYDYVVIPFTAKIGSQVALNMLGFSAVAANMYLAKSDNAETPVYPLELASASFTVDKQIDCLVIRVLIKPEGGARFEGAFDIRSSFNSILTTLNSSWEGRRVVMLDIYGVDGTLLAKEQKTPLPYDILHEFQYKQVNGYLYVAHSSFLPQRFEFASENGETVYKWTDAVSFQPSLETPVEGLSISYGNDAKGVVLAGESGAITANIDFFTSDMVGTQLKLEYSDEGVHTYKFWESDPLSSKVTIAFTPSGRVTVKPEGGIWDGILLLEESTDNGNSWYEIGRTTSVEGSENTQFDREVYNVKSMVRARMKEQRSVTSTDKITVEAHQRGCFFNIFTEARCNAWVEITAVNSARSATVKFLNPARKYITKSTVYKSSWNSIFGYPRSVDIHEERLAFGGTINQPSTIWLSQTNNWDNFRSISNLDTDPLAYTLASDDGEPVAWIISKSDLMIGLGSSEWSLGSRDASQSLTSSIVRASNQSEDGVEYIMPAKAGNMVIYVRRGNLELGSITYDFASDAYNSISLTTMNPQILGDGVVNIFNQLSPQNRIYALRKDGIVAVFTFDKENNVAAWSRFILGDGVVSACALSTGGFKSVFFVVKRNGYLCLERLDPNEMKTGNWKDCVPISEEIEVPEGLKTSVPYESIVRTTPIFAEGNVKIYNVEFIMLNSYGGQYRLVGWTAEGKPFDHEEDWRRIRMDGDVLPAKPTPKDYRFMGNCDSGFLEEASIEVKTSEASPFTMCAMALKAGEV